MDCELLLGELGALAGRLGNERAEPIRVCGSGLLRGFRTVVSVVFLCCYDLLLVSVVDVVGPLVAKR